MNEVKRIVALGFRQHREDLVYLRVEPRTVDCPSVARSETDHPETWEFHQTINHGIDVEPLPNGDGGPGPAALCFGDKPLQLGERAVHDASFFGLNERLNQGPFCPSLPHASIQNSTSPILAEPRQSA